MNRLYPYGWATGNCAIGDLNGDGWADLFFAGTTTCHKLFIQKEGFTFEDVSSSTGIDSKPDNWGSAAVIGDVDRDGDNDVYVVNFGSPNQLFVNISRGGVPRFVEMAEEFGVDLNSGCLGASFVDFNGDGWLDLFVQTYHYEPLKGRPDKIDATDEKGIARLPEEWEKSYLAYFDREKKAHWVEAGLSDVLLINNRNGQFVVPEAGLALGRSYGTSHVWWDLDSDLKA